MMIDPRANGFNYGIGWGSNPKPKIYYEGMDLAHKLNAEASKMSARAWKLDHAVRAVRLAETYEEKQRAIAELREAIEVEIPNRKSAIA